MANEKRLIDANALQLEPDPWGGMNGVLLLGRSGGKTMATVQTALKRMIDNAPTVDAVEVVHGRWAHLGGDEWCCTACGEVIHTEGSWEKPDKKYCYECGAKMDGDGNE